MNRADFRFFHPFRVRYSEIDGQAVVYNAHYLTYFDTAIFEYCRVIGYDQFAEAKALNIDWHVVRALVEFKAPLHYDMEFDCAVRTQRIGTTSITYALAIFPKGSDALLATGEIVQVYTDQATHKPTPISGRVRAFYTGYEAVPGG